MGKFLAVVMLGLSLATEAQALPVGTWLFDEGEGNVAGDSSGFDNHGAVSEPVWVTDTPFSYEGNYALDFNGAGASVDAGNGESLNLTGPYTIEAWVKPRSAGLRYIADKFHTYGLKLDDGTQRPLAFIKQGGGWYDAVSSDTIPLGAWSHVAAVYDGADLLLFVNGELKGSNPLTGSPAFDNSIDLAIGNFFIGRFGEDAYPFGQYYFDGLIDEVRVSDRALRAEQLGFHHTVNPIPEPSSLFLVGLGVMGLISVYRPVFMRGN